MSSPQDFIAHWNHEALQAANRHGVLLTGATGVPVPAQERAHASSAQRPPSGRYYNELSGPEKARLRAENPALWASMRAAPNPPVTWNELMPLHRAQLRAEDVELAERMRAAPDGPERWAPPGEYV